MSRLLQILGGIHRLEGAIANGETYLKLHPEDISFLAATVSSKRLLERRKLEWANVSRDHRSEIVRYTVYGGKTYSAPHVRDICNVFTSFETAVLLTAQSTLMGSPQRTRRLEAPIQQAALRYGYLFSDRDNQLGIVASTRGEHQMEFEIDDLNTLEINHPKRLQRVPDEILKKAASEVFTIAQAKKPDQIAEFASRRGPAVVAEIDEWCKGHTRALLDVEAGWGDDAAMKVQATAHQMETLTSMIEMLSDNVRYDVIEAEGQFYVLNRNTRYFGFKTSDGTHITGRFPKGIFDDKRPAKMPRSYRAIFSVKSRFNEALGRDMTIYEIMDISEI